MVDMFVQLYYFSLQTVLLISYEVSLTVSCLLSESLYTKDLENF